MSFFEELKRRNVFRVGIAYLIVAWLVLQVTDIVAPILELPDVFSKGVLLLVAIGLPLAIILAWAYEMTPEGVKKEKDVDRSQSITQNTGRKLDFAIIGVLSVAVAIFAWDKFVWSGGSIPQPETLVAETVELDKSIAVLPFVNRSADESDVYFVDGIHDDILTQLHKVSGIDKVISRTSMERYRDTEMSIPEIAAELGVATILEGSVQRAGDRVRITVQLIGAANDEHMWAENFDRELTTANVFEIQSEISTAIAKSLQAALTIDEENDLSDLPTQNLAAYDAYLLGKHTLRLRVFSEYPRARAYFEEAIELDPEFALAYVGLADAINLNTVFSGSRITAEERVAALSEARSAAMQALEINDRLGEAYAALGYSHWQLGSATEAGAEALRMGDTHYKMALELTPNYADLYRWYAQLLWMSAIGRPVDALNMAQRSVELDPMFAVNHTILGMAYSINGQHDEALASFETSLEISPSFGLAASQWAEAQLEHSQYADVIVVEMERYDVARGGSSPLGRIALAYRALGDIERLEYWSTRAIEQGAASGTLNQLTVIRAIDGGDMGSALQILHDRLSNGRECWGCVDQVVHIYANNNQPEALLAFVEEYVPHLLSRDSSSIPPQAAMSVASVTWALKETGEQEQASVLVEKGLEVARTGNRQAMFGYGVEIADVEMYAVMGNNRFALDALIQAVDDGYRNPGWIDGNHLLDPIRDEPEFIAAVEIIRADLAAQLEQLKVMERNGELPALPR